MSQIQPKLQNSDVARQNALRKQEPFELFVMKKKPEPLLPKEEFCCNMATD
jgi:hypothetical protein